MVERAKGKQVMLTMPETLYLRLKAYANENCMSMSAAGTMAVKQFMDAQDKMPMLSDMVKGFTDLMSGKVPVSKEALDALEDVASKVSE